MLYIGAGISVSIAVKMDHILASIMLFPDQLQWNIFGDVSLPTPIYLLYVLFSLNIFGEMVGLDKILEQSASTLSH